MHDTVHNHTSKITSNQLQENKKSNDRYRTTKRNQGELKKAGANTEYHTIEQDTGVDLDRDLEISLRKQRPATAHMKNSRSIANTRMNSLNPFSSKNNDVVTESDNVRTIHVDAHQSKLQNNPNSQSYKTISNGFHNNNDMTGLAKPNQSYISSTPQNV